MFTARHRYNSLKLMRRLLFLLVAVALITAASAQSVEEHVLRVSKKEAFALGPKTFCCQGMFFNLTVSPDGRYVFGQRIVMSDDLFFKSLAGDKPANPPLIKTTIFDSKFKRTVDLNLDSSFGPAIQAEYLFDGLFLISSSYGIQGIADSTGKVRSAGALAGKFWRVVPVPGLRAIVATPFQFEVPTAAAQDSSVNRQPPQQQPCILTNENGVVIRDLTTQLQGYRVLDAGSNADSIRLLNMDDRRQLVELNLRSGTVGEAPPEAPLTTISAFFRDEKQSGSPARRVHYLTGYAQESEESPDPKFRKIEPIFYVGEVVSQVSSDNSTLYYSDLGGLYRVSIKPIDIEELEKMLRAKEKLAAMQKAKMVGTGILIYSADYDDALPLGDGWDKSIFPYLRDSNLTDGFQYMFNGGSLKDIKDPANTEMGRVETQYGSAVVYADGHVKWESQDPVAAIDLKRRPQLINSSARLMPTPNF